MQNVERRTDGRENVRSDGTTCGVRTSSARVRATVRPSRRQGGGSYFRTVAPSHWTLALSNSRSVAPHEGVFIKCLLHSAFRAHPNGGFRLCHSVALFVRMRQRQNRRLREVIAAESNTVVCGTAAIPARRAISEVGKNAPEARLAATASPPAGKINVRQRKCRRRVFSAPLERDCPTFHTQLSRHRPAREGRKGHSNCGLRLCHSVACSYACANDKTIDSAK